MIRSSLITILIYFMFSCSSLCAQQSLLQEIDYYDDFLKKFLPENTEKIIVVHIRKLATDKNSYAYAISSVYDNISLPYINPKYMFDHANNLVLVKTDLSISELPLKNDLIKYNHDHELIKKHIDFDSKEKVPYASLIYCYVFYQFDQKLTDFWIGRMEDIPRTLDFYTNEDIYRVEGKWPDFAPYPIR